MTVDEFMQRRSRIPRDIYNKVTEEHVPRAKVRAAAAALRWASRDLDLPPIRIQWFDVRPSRTNGDMTQVLSGHCPSTSTPEEIGIRCGCARITIRHPSGAVGDIHPLRPADIAANVMHELAHVRHNLDVGGVNDDDPEQLAQSEEIARAYQRRNAKLAKAMGDPGWPRR